jgi:surface carbohydrate biosynthesis protein
VNPPSEGRPLYLLLEETSRELAARVLIATVAANSGLVSYIIPQWFAWEHANELPPGIMLFKGHNRAQAIRMVAAREAGHQVAAIEEEILGVASPEQTLRVFHPDAMSACDLFLLQGAHARDILLSRHPEIEARVAITGNPRTDLLMPPFDGEIRERAKAIRESQGDYILINTNFGSTNPRVEDSVSDFEACARVGLIDPNSPADRADYIGWCTWERRNMALLAEVIAACGRSPLAPKIIIRPHPSENIERWKQAFPDDDRLAVIREGEHTAWTAAAKLLLHTGCTTGVEASLLGTPTLSLQGGVSDWHRAHTSNFVNQTATSVNEAMMKITAVFSGDETQASSTPEMRAELERQLLPPGEGTAAERIVAALLTLNARDEESGGHGKILSAFSTRPLLAAEHKIEPSAFTPAAIGAMATRFASSMGNLAAPAVSGIGGGMVRVSSN